MSAGAGILGIGALLGIGYLVKKKIENLENEIRILNGRNNALFNENRELQNIIRNKDSELAQKDEEITKLKKELQLKKSPKS